MKLLPAGPRDFAQDELHHDCADKHRSSTKREAQQGEQPQAVSLSYNTLQGFMYDAIITKKRFTEYCKRLLEINVKEDSTSTGPMKQTHTDSLEDERVVMKVHQTSDFRANSPESSGNDSSLPPSSPSKSDQTADKVLLAAEEQVDNLYRIPYKLYPIPRNLYPISYRISSPPPTTCTIYVQAQKAGVHIPDITGPQSPKSHSSLDSETSPSEQCSMNGSQLSLSAASGKYVVNYWVKLCINLW